MIPGSGPLSSLIWIRRARLHLAHLSLEKSILPSDQLSVPSSWKLRQVAAAGRFGGGGGGAGVTSFW